MSLSAPHIVCELGHSARQTQFVEPLFSGSAHVSRRLATKPPCSQRQSLKTKAALNTDVRGGAGRSTVAHLALDG